MIFYAHDFRTQGLGDWQVQASHSAPFTLSPKFGLGIAVDSPGEWSEFISQDASVGPNSVVQARVYIPLSGGKVANWPALWSTGANWPDDGEIDMLEGQHGYAALETHWGTAGVEASSNSELAPLNTGGWLTITVIRKNGEVSATYDGTNPASYSTLGPVPMPSDASQSLIFQNQYRYGGGGDDGPYKNATAWLAWVKVTNY